VELPLFFLKRERKLALLIGRKNADVNFCASRRENARRWEKSCPHSLKAMLPETKKDARLKPAATFAGAEIWLRRVGSDVGGTTRRGYQPG
jgi:hypothetical protein